METSGFLYWPCGQITINVAKSEECTASKARNLDKLFDNSTSMDSRLDC